MTKQVLDEVTLRDWLAGMALQGFLAAGRSQDGGYGDICDAETAADYAYDQADAMLKRRESQPTYANAAYARKKS